MNNQPAKNRESNSSGRPPVPFYGWIGPVMAVLYLLRGSVLIARWPSLDRSLMYLSLSALVIFGVYVFNAQRKLQIGCFLLLLAWIPGAAMSNYPAQSMTNWVTMLVLISSLGPVFLSKRSRIMRQRTWTVIMWGCYAMGVLSFVWWVLGLPNYGRGDFSGISSHANTLGPLAAIAVVGAFAKALTSKDKKWWIAIVAVSLITILVSGSRAALLAAAIGLIIICVFEWRKMWRWILLIMIVGAVALVIQDSKFSQSLTGTIEKKGLNADSRIHVWKARLSEFESSKTFGVGVGIGEGLRTNVQADTNRIKVEAGSSYIALLSMTGIVGAISFMLVVYTWGHATFASRRGLMREQKYQQWAVIGVLLVHALFEGWIMAVGSPFCMIFWLLLGHMTDQALFARKRLMQKKRKGKAFEVNKIRVPTEKALTTAR